MCAVILKVKIFEVCWIKVTCVFRVQCVLGESVLGCMCVSGASGCGMQVCVGYMCVSDASVCWGKAYVGDMKYRGHVSLILLTLVDHN